MTLADVAAASGVSVTTASLVLTGRARELRISEAAEQRVRSTAHLLGYRRGGPPARPRARTIGLVLEPGAPDVVRGVAEAASWRGFSLLVMGSGGEPVNGVVHVAGTRTTTAPRGLRPGPVVLLNSTAAAVPSVVPDEVRGGRAAARVLVEAGHRHVHLVGAGPGRFDVPPDGITALERLIGLRDVFDAAGVAVSGSRCPEWTPEAGYDATRALVRHCRPTALVCLDDRLAFGAQQALTEAGLSTPRDVSVLGFGDDPAASWMRPQLTTVAVSRHELGARAVAVLTSLLDTHVLPAPLVHRVPPRVRLRASVAPPNRCGG
ncbi:LacI family transcriptional regulator [Lentzea fradiae]|uniref:LacI family transcriptional regulator n=1 Tax=Lentzea fradiae TaxID=200378 RepID=A0A1G7VH53_9PSEU|nr:LacI family transcriptional regulator [Lentzea fradiae]